MSKNNPKVASHDFFDLIFGISVKNDGDPSRKIFKSSYGDPFRDKKVFENHGVNHWSNFPGPTPKTKVAPNPIFPKKIFLTFFLKKYF